MSTIGFVGLGIMGQPMAANLVRAGHRVQGYTRHPHHEALEVLGIQVAGSVRDAVAGAETVITMLPDSPDVAEVLGAPRGVFDLVTPGTLVIDMSTIQPEVSRHLAEIGHALGLCVLDAPVSGGEQAAVDGTLSIMVGGSEADLERALPVLEVLGSTVVHVGSSGAGQLVKAANQLVVAGNIQLISEALTLLEANDVDPELGVQVLSGGLAGSTVLDRKARSMLDADFRPGFRVDLHHKDLGIVVQTARESGVAIPLGSAVAVLLSSLRARGHGSLDHTALLLLERQLSGRRARA